MTPAPNTPPTIERVPRIELFGSADVGERIVLSVDLVVPPVTDDQGGRHDEEVGDWEHLDVDVVLVSDELEFDSEELASAVVRLRRNARSRRFLISGTVGIAAGASGSVQLQAIFFCEGRRIGYARTTYPWPAAHLGREPEMP